MVSLNPDRVLLIVIDSTGRIEQRAVQLTAHSDLELNGWRDRLNQRLVGLQSANARRALAEEFKPTDADAERAREIVAGIAAMLEVDPSAEVLVAGVPNLTRYGASYENAIQPVLEALEEQVVLLRLLGEAVGAQPGEVAIRIGQENTYVPLHSTSLVASPYGADEVRATLEIGRAHV